MISFINKLLGFGNNEQLANYIREGAILVDVRTVGEFKSGSVPGAVNIPLDKLEGQLHKLPQQSKIVVFCRSGMRSGQAKRILENKGYTQVINGGTKAKISKAKSK
ncbi:rhodanese-like domain-containing protein [Myroides sp. BIT-d1]|uniref:Rhodanese-like domain-containing protein n=1 Tax=Myroides albus TaxID=2562892 RepID=A0A6I3LJ25_9FLAO|nr:rhodanese-like domain-containing protein [Myroides albus]MTG97180.1 rhodanese-like domain-containing protein [Myroides albus]